MNFSRSIKPTHRLSNLPLPPQLRQKLESIANSTTTASTPAANTLLLTGSPSASKAAAEAIAHSTGARTSSNRSRHVDLQIHRRDGKEPRSRLSERRSLSFHPLLRRSRRPLRQAFRGQGQPRPLRQRRKPIPSATPGILLRHGHLCHHLGGQTSLRKTVPAHPPPCS